MLFSKEFDNGGWVLVGCHTREHGPEDESSIEGVSWLHFIFGGGGEQVHGTPQLWAPL